MDVDWKTQTTLIGELQIEELPNNNTKTKVVIVPWQLVVSKDYPYGSK